MKETENLGISIDDIERAIQEHSNEIQEQFLSKMVTLIIAGFGLITVLAWDKVLEDIFLKIFGQNEITLISKILYALAITLLATVASVFISKYFIKKDTKRFKRRYTKKRKMKK